MKTQLPFHISKSKTVKAVYGNSERSRNPLAIPPWPSIRLPRPVDADGDLIYLNAAEQHNVKNWISRWQAADRSSEWLLPQKPNREKHVWMMRLGSAAAFHAALIDGYRLQEAFTVLYNFDRFDFTILTLNNIGKAISDAMKVTLLKRALVTWKFPSTCVYIERVQTPRYYPGWRKTLMIIHDFDQDTRKKIFTSDCS